MTYVTECILHFLKCKNSGIFKEKIEIATLLKIDRLINNKAKLICNTTGEVMNEKKRPTFSSCIWCGTTLKGKRFLKHANKCAQSYNNARALNRLDYAEIEYIEKNGHPSGRLYSTTSKHKVYPLSKKLNQLADKIIKAASTLRIDRSSIAVIRITKGDHFLENLLKNQPAIVNNDGSYIYSSKCEVDRIHQELLQRFDIDNMEMAFALNRSIAGHGYFLQERHLDDTEVSTSIKALTGGTVSLKR